MRLVSFRNVLSPLGFFAFFALAVTLAGCPEKGGAPVDSKASSEPERQEPDDEGKAPEARKPAPAASAVDDKKPDDAKDEGGW
jgi:hypothetical protein